jgi:hypothetical protein
MQHQNLLSTFVLCLLVWQAGAQSFRAVLEPDTVLLGNVVKVSFTIKDSDGRNFEAPSFRGFDLVSGPNTSSSFQMMNGRTTREVSYSYYLKPRDIGVVFIDPARVEIDGLIVETPALEVVVEPNPEGLLQSPAPRRAPQFSPGRNREGLDDPEPVPVPQQKRKTIKL